MKPPLFLHSVSDRMVQLGNGAMTEHYCRWLNIRPEIFVKLAHYMAKEGFRELHFDDALESVYGAALHALSCGLKVTVFVPTRFENRPFMSSTEKVMDWGRIESLWAQGVKIGSHGHFHMSYDLPETYQQLVADDIAQSIEQLGRLFGGRFSLPYGRAAEWVFDSGLLSDFDVYGIDGPGVHRAEANDESIRFEGKEIRWNV